MSIIFSDHDDFFMAVLDLLNLRKTNEKSVEQIFPI